MNREIKFRAWDGEKKQMLTIEDNNLCVEFASELISFTVGESHIVGNADDLIVMQFTGLKDKNGKEIYEGDILLWIKVKGPRIGEKQYHEVVFEKGEWRVCSKKITKRLIDCTNHELVGNIYENPELLK